MEIEIEIGDVVFYLFNQRERNVCLKQDSSSVSPRNPQMKSLDNEIIWQDISDMIYKVDFILTITDETLDFANERDDSQFFDKINEKTDSQFLY